MDMIRASTPAAFDMTMAEYPASVPTSTSVRGLHSAMSASTSAAFVGPRNGMS
jgi:hypothetical protein